MSRSSRHPESPSLVATAISVEIPGVRTLIDEFSICLNPGDKVGVIGAEGTGKSTLLRVLAREEIPGLQVKGAISGPRPAILHQSLAESWTLATVSEFLLQPRPGEEVPPDRWNDLQQAVEAIVDVGLDPARFTGDREPAMGDLSGGERVRVRLAKLLMARPEVLLLDEPTNDLDLPTLIWLEQFIQDSQAPIAFISHDETLLERCANRILYLQRLVYSDRTDLRLESMGYHEFVDYRRRGIEKQEIEAASQRRERHRAESVLREHKSKVQSAQEKVKDSSARRLLNKRMRVITTREAKLAKNPTLERPEDVEAIRITLPEAVTVPSSRRLLDLELPVLEIAGIELARNVELHLKGPEKLVIIGDNGTGKSTLIRVIVEHLASLGRVPFGYFPQNYEEELEDPDRRAADYVIDPDRGVDETMAGILMGRLNIPREEMEAPVHRLSGGQKAKIVLLRLMTGAGFLILDEPTRNLSPLSNEVLRSALREFPGAILAVSHDRAFVQQVADRVLELTPGGLQERDLAELKA